MSLGPYGKMFLEHLREFRPQQYRRLVQTGQLEAECERVQMAAHQQVRGTAGRVRHHDANGLSGILLRGSAERERQQHEKPELLHEASVVRLTRCAMEHLTAADHEIDERITKWIPLIGPGAALYFLFVVYLILDFIFMK